MPQLYRRGRKFWARCYYLDRENGVRRCVRRSTGIIADGSAQTRRTAEHIARDIEQSLAAGVGRKARPITLKQAVRRMILDLELGQRSQSTIEIAIEKAAHLFAHFGPDRPADAITADDLRNYATARIGENAHPGTVEREIRTLRQALKASGITPPRAPDLGRTYTPRERVLDASEQRRLLLAVKPQWRDHVVCYLKLGLRESELYRIAPTDIDFGVGEVRVRGTKTGDSDRWLPMTPEVAAILRRRSGAAPMFARWGNVQRDLKRAAEAAGIAPCTPNDLRRSYATELAAAGCPILVLQRLMGHRGTRMLERVYAHAGRGRHVHDVVSRLATLRPTEALRAAEACTHSVPETAGTVDDTDGDA